VAACAAVAQELSNNTPNCLKIDAEMLEKLSKDD
jgi:hypothetical protein